MEASKSREGKYLDDPDGGGVEMWEGRGGRDDGGLVRAEQSCVRGGRCGECVAMTAECARRRPLSIMDSYETLTSTDVPQGCP